ncbi:hypothetical protein ACOMICROBIO_GDFFDHBD_01642 [Vibrio sp. B1REV9]|nr:MULTISPECIES: DUF2913 family protein [Vibrio]WQE75154.1 DUF2913 family protein [Vibrio alfacsensis]BBM64469.1 hypothetical protein VA249_11150 [Vibrio alfacsensis]CAE6903075.1 hypothetical protein ACOMICROBIO_GDFFDHBD_01642 [Vibrio sp. B1REV9]
MSNYTTEIQNLVNAALSELEQEHRSGKLANAPIANNLYLVRWVTKALKAQRFDRCVLGDLTRWQKAGRSKGNDAGLLFIFKRISAYYAHCFPEGQESRVIKDSEIDAFLDKIEQEGWEVSTSEPLIGFGKVQIFTEGQNSLALCADQCDNCFDGERMVKPMSWFVRGNHADFVEKASQAGFMVHKVTDYKSMVKYHGEYLIFPENQGNQLAEIPLSFKAD